MALHLPGSSFSWGARRGCHRRAKWLSARPTLLNPRPQTLSLKLPQPSHTHSISSTAQAKERGTTQSPQTRRPKSTNSYLKVVLNALITILTLFVTLLISTQEPPRYVYVYIYIYMYIYIYIIFIFIYMYI